MKPRYFISHRFACCLINTKATAQDTNWIKRIPGYFDNFVKDTLSWAIFRETFIGVAPACPSDFDQLFYTYLFRDQLASKGHCYGMDVMAMLMKKNGGHLGYCHPPYMYSGSYASNTTPVERPAMIPLVLPTRNLRTAIEMVHVTRSIMVFFHFLLDVIVKHKTVTDAMLTSRWTITLLKMISRSSALRVIYHQKGGHVLIPYFTETLEEQRRSIYVVPTEAGIKAGPDGHDWYVNRNNFVEINAGSAWTYHMCCDTVWQAIPEAVAIC